MPPSSPPYSLLLLSPWLVMQGFVHRVSPDNRKSGPPGATDREAVAANAKVPISQTADPSALQPLGKGPSRDGGLEPHVKSSPSDMENVASALDRREAWDTDAGSLDTTSNGTLDATSQAVEPASQFVLHDGIDIDTQDFHQLQPPQQQEVMNRWRSYLSRPTADVSFSSALARDQRSLLHHGTGGLPGFDHAEGDQHGQVVISGENGAHYHQPNSPLRPTSVPMAHGLFTRGATIRTSHHPDTMVAVRQSHTKLEHPTQVPPCSQLEIQAVPDASFRNRGHSLLPRNGARHSSKEQQLIAEDGRKTPLGSGTPDHLASNLNTSRKRHQPESCQVSDYTAEKLARLSYKELKDESFDTDPRPPPPVLSPDMLRKPLEERLEHVKQSLAFEDQHRFFSSLSLSEWEEAGSWFGVQFGQLMQKMQEARHQTRKLAREFEVEIELRNEDIAKKQCKVEDAMAQMKSHGQGILPRTPKRDD